MRPLSYLDPRNNKVYLASELLSDKHEKLSIRQPHINLLTVGDKTMLNLTTWSFVQLLTPKRCICNCGSEWKESLNKKVQEDKLVAEVASWLYSPTLCCVNLSS